MGALFTSCETNHNITVEVEKQTVNFSAKNFITETSEGFQSKMNYQTLSTDEDYIHIFPATFKAYFVSKENKGSYIVGQVVEVIDVVAGDNTITIPMLNYDVYVTNYDHPGYDESLPWSWYTFPDAFAQLPHSSDELYLYGRNNINYSIVDEGEVTLENPYSAVMIKDNVWVTGAPLFYGDNKLYIQANSTWYLRYIRNNTTNTMIPISIPGFGSNTYTLNQPIDANKIYKYIINGDVGNTDGDGNFTVIVEDFEEEIEEVIDIF